MSNFLSNKSLYLGEKITMSEHMIQTAMIAEEKNSSSDLVCSSLLHDYGHFILEKPDDLVKKNKDGKHEEIGYELALWFDVSKKEVATGTKVNAVTSDATMA